MEIFNKAQVVMLPTEDATGLMIQTMNYCGNFTDRILQYITNETSIRNRHLISNRKASTNCLDKYEFYNLYIISDDEIQENDWCYYKNGNLEGISQIINGQRPKTMLLKKIIATTNTSLNIEIRVNPDHTDKVKFNLPQPSQQFIEEYIRFYNKDGVIKNILVKYNINICYGECGICDNYCSKQILKIDSNTITIKIAKESYNKQELVNLIEKALTHKDNGEIGYLLTAQGEIRRGNFNHWIEKHV